MVGERNIFQKCCLVKSEFINLESATMSRETFPSNENINYVVSIASSAKFKVAMETLFNQTTSAEGESKSIFFLLS